MIITHEENELLLALVQEYEIKPYDPKKHVTVKTLTESLNIKDKRAYVILEERYNAGELDREKVKQPGSRWQWGYFINSKKD